MPVLPRIIDLEHFNPYIRFNKLSKYYLESCALKEANGSIGKGEKVLVTGENGSGKSTFLKLISGQIISSGGEIFLQGKLLNSHLRKLFSVLGESKFLYLDLSLKENLELFLKHKELVGKALKLCSEFELDYSSNAKIRELSSGQKQKASLVRALASTSDILVLDEPLNFLDGSSKSKLAQILTQTTRTVVLVSHETDYFNEFRKVEIRHGVLSC